MGMPDVMFSGVIRPEAEVFPLLPEEELAALAADIAAHGLRLPIVLASSGALVDGRNRLAACRQAGVAPHFTTLPPDTDIAAWVWSANAPRRHLTQGAKAMGAALLDRFSGKQGIRVIAADAQVSAAGVAKAVVVRDYAPELVEAVQRGASLNDAYAIALERKRQQDAEQQALTTMRREYPELAAQVDAGTLTRASPTSR